MTNKMKNLLPYFLLALAVLIAHKAIQEFSSIREFAKLTWQVVAPFFYGFAIAYLLNIPTCWVERFIKNKARLRARFVQTNFLEQNKGSHFSQKRVRAISIFTVLATAMAIAATLTSLIIPAITTSIVQFLEKLPLYLQTAREVIGSINRVGIPGLHINEAMLENQIGNINAEDILRPAFFVGRQIFTALVALVVAVYALFEKPRLKAFSHRVIRLVLSPRAGLLLLLVWARLDKYFRQYIHSQTIDGLIVGAATAVVMFVLGSPYGWVMGLGLLVLNYIPYFGSIAGTAIAILLVFFTQGMWRGVIAAVVLVVLQVIDANYIQPKLLSRSLTLSPLLIIFSLAVGGAVGGIFGMIVAIPLVAVGKDLLGDVMEYCEGSR